MKICWRVNEKELKVYALKCITVYIESIFKMKFRYALTGMQVRYVNEHLIFGKYF